MRVFCRLKAPLRHLDRARAITQLSPLSLHNFHRALPPLGCRTRFLDTSSIEYEWIPDVEHLEACEPGGYHPVTINQTIHQRYHIVHKLGHGGYSTIWLARDQELRKYVALKIGVANAGTVHHEIAVLRTLNTQLEKWSPQNWNATWTRMPMVPEIYQEFQLEGPNGRQPCYTLPLMQCDLRQSSFSRLFHVPVARTLAAKLALIVAFLHAHKICHGDINLKNILVGLSEPIDDLSPEEFVEKYGEPDVYPIARKDGLPLPINTPPVATVALSWEKHARDFVLQDATRLILSDFGEAFCSIVDQNPRLGKDSHIPLAMRAPEAFFEPDKRLTYASDIWSLGLAIWDIIGMTALFNQEYQLWSENIGAEIVAQQIDVLGEDHLPLSWKAAFDAVDVAENDDCLRRPKDDRIAKPPLEQAFEEYVQKSRIKREKFGVFDAEETTAILTLMRGILHFDPAKRMTVEQVLQSEWMVNWALPELHKGMQAL